MLREWLARSMIALGLVIAAGVPAVGWWQHSQNIVLHAQMAETGGWTPENLTAEVGKPLHLRLTSDDVTHGFAVGQINNPPVEVVPGEMSDVTLVFDKPGKYTFYCTRWCSVNHWRMRGTIEVSDPNLKPEPAKSPLFITLGLDIDADHKAPVVPAQKPSAWRGEMLKQPIPESYKSREYYLSHTPVDVWFSLRSEPDLIKLSDQEIWDLVAFVWSSNTKPDELQLGKELYGANCAACHGEKGEGNGVFAEQLAGNSNSKPLNQAVGERTQLPADFTNAAKMLSASPAHLQGKIIRGGMGTGMPYWGPIFSQDQLWALVTYLWTYQFNLEVNP